MLQLLKPECPGASAPQKEKPLQREACAPQLENALCSLHREKACAQQERPSTAKNR